MLIPRLWYVTGLGLHRGTPARVETIRDVGRLERWGHRAEIRHRDEPSEVYVVLSGSIDLHDGAHDLALRLRAGDIYGETGEGEGGKSRVRAYDDTVISALDRTTFDEVAVQNLAPLEAQVGIVRRHSLAVPAAMLLYTPPRRRLAKVFLHLAEQYGRVRGDEGRLQVGLKSKSLARVSGLAPRSVSDIFDAMQRDRIIEVGRSELVIPSLELMRDLAIGER